MLDIKRVLEDLGHTIERGNHFRYDRLLLHSPSRRPKSGSTVFTTEQMRNLQTAHDRHETLIGHRSQGLGWWHHFQLMMSSEASDLAKHV